jgi:predicted Zn-dependent peptidase
MEYIKITPTIHLVIDQMDRKQLDIEVVFSAGGSVYEPENHRGKKHLMEHCIASRTRDMDLKEFKNWQFRENILINAYTTPTILGLTSSSHKSQFQIALDCVLEMAFAPTFDQAVLDQEKEIVLREISERSGDPEYKLYFATMEKVFSKESIDNHQTLGEYDKVKQTILQDFEQLHSQNLRNSNIVINLIGGGIDIEYAKSQIQKWANLPNQELQNQSSKFDINFKPKSQLLEFKYLPFVHELAHEHANLTIFLPCKYDFSIQPSARLFDELFLRYYGKLYHILRDELGYVYGISSEFRYDIQALEISMSCESQYIEPIIEVIRKVFGNFEEYFDENKFNELKKVICLKLDIASDNPEIVNRYINNNFFLFGKFATLTDYEERLSKVSPQDIRDLYENIKSGLDNMQVLAVSKNTLIQSISM